MLLQKLFYSLDFFSITPSLYHQRQKSYKTVYGVIYTLLAFAGFVYTAVFLFERLEYETKYDYTVHPISEDLRVFQLSSSGLTQRQFNVAFGLSDRHNSSDYVEDDNYGLL